MDYRQQNQIKRFKALKFFSLMFLPLSNELATLPRLVSPFSDTRGIVEVKQEEIWIELCQKRN